MAAKQLKVLHFSIRQRVISKYIGQLLLVLAIFFSVPLLFSFAVGEFDRSWSYVAIVVLSGVSGYILQRLEVPREIQNNETLVISALIFIGTSLLAALPFYQLGLSFMDAFFEAVSGITTTGLTSLPSVEILPKTFQFTRAWLQWLGGLGIVVLSVAIILPQSKVALDLFTENWEKKGLIAGTRSYAQAILKIYLIITFAGFLLLTALGVSWLDSLNHVLAAISTGGFSRYDNSLAGLPGLPAQVAVIGISFLGAMPLVIYYSAFREGRSKFTVNPEIRGLVIVSFSAAVATIVILMEVDGFSLKQALGDGTMLALSAQTTTGFSTVSVAELSGAAKFLLIIFMLIGGNIGSTAGGIKIIRLLIILKMIKYAVVSSGMTPSAVIQPRIMGKSLETADIERCFLLVFLFIAVISFSWFVFLFLGYPSLDSLFEVVSATCTVGLSTGITASGLPTLAKAVLCLDMLMGRLEIVAFLVLFYPPTWFGRKKE